MELTFIFVKVEGNDKMKKAIGELSLSIITILFFIILSVFGDNILESFTIKIKNFGNLNQNAKSSSNLGNYSFGADSGNKSNLQFNDVELLDNNSFGRIDLDFFESALPYHVNIQVDSMDDLSSSQKKKLKRKTEKNLSLMQHKKAFSCQKKCDDITGLIPKSNQLQFEYYHTNKYYIVNVTSDDNYFSFFYRKMNSGFELFSLSNNKESSSEKRDSDMAVSETEKFNVNYNYGEDYLSKAEVSNRNFSSNDKIANKIYKENINNILKLNTYNEQTIVASATGFFLVPGLVVTSWSYVKSSLESGQFISVVSDTNVNYDVEGIVDVNREADVAILKLTSLVGDYAEFETSSLNEEVLMLGTFGGFGISGQVGMVLSTGEKQVNLLHVCKENFGSPLYNSSGNVVGMITSDSTRDNLSISISEKILKQYQLYYKKYSFSEINSLSFSLSRKKYFVYDLTVENSSIHVLQSDLKEYNYFVQLFSSRVIRAESANNSIILRYKFDEGNTNQFLNYFTKNLEKNNYKMKFDSDYKKVYFDKKYKVSLILNFNYIIVIIERM